MTVKRRGPLKSEIARREWRGTALLVSGAILVGASILAGGQLGRVLNGLSGVLWFGAAVLLVMAASDGRRHPRTWLVVIASTAVVAFFIRPGDLVPAAGGFLVAGVVVGWSAVDRPVFWAKLVPALYLPMHIGSAVARAIVRDLAGQEESIRTDPPPTAFMVPVVMVVGAMAGGLLARYLPRRTSHRGERRITSRSGAR